jgi:hypothetical protein
MASTKSPSRNIEWKIKNVTKELLTEGKRLSSDVFEVPFDKKMTKWYLRAYIEDSYMNFYLHHHETNLIGFSTKCDIFIRALSNKKERNIYFRQDYSMFNGGYGSSGLISINAFLEKFDEYIINGTMIIGAKVEVLEPENKVSITDRQHLVMYKDYFITKSYSDLTIICSDGIEIQAHRVILAMASHVFKEMIDLNPSNIIQVDDIDTKTMTEILRYIYSYEVKDIEKFAPKLIFGAEKYRLSGLKDHCAASMIKNLSPKNAVDYFLLADQYDVKDLLNCCFKFIQENFEILFKDVDRWDRLDKKHLNMILRYFIENPKYIYILESSF